MQLDHGSADTDERPRPKRRDAGPDAGSDSDSDDADRVCAWCRQRYARRVPVDCVRAASEWLYAQLAPHAFGHRACVYSACQASVPRGRDDLVSTVRALLAADGGDDDLHYVPPARARSRHPVQ